MNRAASQPIDTAFSATAALRLHVLTETDLGRLTDRFAAALSEHGIDGHYCARGGESGRVTPLFGDSPGLLSADDVLPSLDGGENVDAAACSIAIDCALEAPVEMVVSRPVAPLDPAMIARVRGYATLYVGRGLILHAKAAGPVTACGLSLCERFILGRLLVGDSVIDIAERLERPVATIMVEIADAVATLGAADRAGAIALAARRGWLVTTVNDFPALSRENIGYYS